MNAINIREAQAILSELIHRMTPGEEVLLTEDDRPVAKLVATVTERPKTPKLGTQAGSVLYMAPDFDAPLDDFKEYVQRSICSIPIPCSGAKTTPESCRPRRPARRPTRPTNGC